MGKIFTAFLSLLFIFGCVTTREEVQVERRDLEKDFKVVNFFSLTIKDSFPNIKEIFNVAIVNDNEKRVAIEELNLLEKRIDQLRASATSKKLEIQHGDDSLFSNELNELRSITGEMKRWEKIKLSLFNVSLYQDDPTKLAEIFIINLDSIVNSMEKMTNYFDMVEDPAYLKEIVGLKGELAGSIFGMSFIYISAEDLKEENLSLDSMVEKIKKINFMLTPVKQTIAKASKRFTTMYFGN